MDKLVFDKDLGLFVAQTLGDLKDIKNFLAINWNVIGKCNNFCTYCFGKDIIQEDCDGDTVFNVVDKINCISPDLLVISGGEPLMCSEIIDIIKKISPSIPLIIDTNGILIDETFISAVKNRGGHLRISLDSHNPEVNEKNRKSGVSNSTKRIIGNIKAVKEAGVPFTVQTTVTEINVDNLFDFGKFLQDSGVVNWRLNLVIPHDNALDIKAGGIYNDLVKKYPALKIRISNSTPKDGNYIVLIDPKGNLSVRNSKENSKTFITRLNGKDVYSKDEIIKFLNLHEHILRYCVTAD